MIYGYTMEPNNPDALADLAEEFVIESSLAAVPMTWLVDTVPALQHLPEMFPGAGFKRAARQYAKTIRLASRVPYQFVQRQMASGEHRQSYVSRLVEQYKPKENVAGGDGVSDLSPEDEEAIVWTATSLMIGAADTTAVVLTAFTLAMVLFPQVQQKAQDEIDLVVGADRLPSLEDRGRLPYVDALEKEALRWWPVLPMGFPHTVTEAIEYNGLHIPKGTTIMPAVWHFMHDPKVYADPDLFDPERFLSPRNEPDRTSAVFGYGRRICPGQLFAHSNMFLAIARSLAVFRIDKPVGEDGRDIEVDLRPTPGIVNIPAMFQPQIIPRSPRHVDLVKQVEAEIPQEAGDSELLDMSLFG